MKLVKLAKLFLKYAEKIYNCRYCGAPHRAVDPSGFVCGQCGTINRNNKIKKEEPIIEEVKQEKVIEKPEVAVSSTNDDELKQSIITNGSLPYLVIKNNESEIEALCVVEPYVGTMSQIDKGFDTKDVDVFLAKFPGTDKKIVEKIIDNASMSGTTVFDEVSINYFLDPKWYYDQDTNEFIIQLFTQDPAFKVYNFSIDYDKIENASTYEIEKILPAWFSRLNANVLGYNNIKDLIKDCL